MKRNKWWRMSWMLLSLLMIFSSVVPAYTVYAEENPEEVQEETVLEGDEEEAKEVIAWESISGEGTTEEVVTEEKQQADATSVWITKADGTPEELKAGNTTYAFGEAEDDKVVFDPTHSILIIGAGFQSVTGLGYQFNEAGHKYAKIYANGNLVILLKGENISLSAVPTDAETSNVIGESYGIYADGDLYIVDQCVAGSGSGSITLRAASGATKKSVGIYCEDYNQQRFLDDTFVKVYTYGGNLDMATAESAAKSVGLMCDGKFSLSYEHAANNKDPENLVLEAYGGNIAKNPKSNAAGTSAGISNYTDYTGDTYLTREDIILGATLKAVGGAGRGWSRGIEWTGVSMDIYGSKVYACGGNTDIDSYGAALAFNDHIWMQNYKDKEGLALDIETEAVFESVAESGDCYGAYVPNDYDSVKDKFGLGPSDDAGTVTFKGKSCALRGNLTAVSVFDDMSDPEGSNAKLALHDGIYPYTTAKYVYATSEKYTETLDKKYYYKTTNRDIIMDFDDDEYSDIFDQIYHGNFGVGDELIYKTGNEEHSSVGNPAFSYTYFDVNVNDKKLEIQIAPNPVPAGATLTFSVICDGTNATRIWNITIEMTAGEPVAAEVAQESIVYLEDLPDPVVTTDGKVDDNAAGFTYKGKNYNNVDYLNYDEKPTEPGTYTVFYRETRANGNTYYGQADFTIEKRDISDAVITFSNIQFVYTGEEQPVRNLAVKIGDTNLTINTDYQVLNGFNATDVQEQHVEIEGKGCYKGTCTSATTWSLRKATPDNTLVNFTTGKSYRYNGKPVKAEVSVKAGIKGLGELLIWYQQHNWKDNKAPSDIGTYDILLYFAEGQNYTESDPTDSPLIGTMNIIKGYGSADIISMPTVKTSSVTDLKDYVKNNTGALSFEIYTGAIGTLDGSKLTAADEATDGMIKISIAASEKYEEGTLYMSVNITAKDVRELDVSMDSYRTGADPKPVPVYTSPTSPLSISREYYGVQSEDGAQYYAAVAPDMAGSYSVTVLVETTDAIYVGCASFTVYDVNVFFVTFDLNGKGENEVVTVEQDEKVAVPAEPKADNLVFGGWFADKEYTTAFDFEQEIKADTSVYAKWIDLCIVSFNMAGHGAAIDPQKVTPGKTATKPADPTAEGFVFGGWYTEEACKNVYDFAAPVTTGITLYAKWIKLCTVSFNMADHGTAIDPQKVEPGKTVTKPADPTAEGFVFGGWYTEEACTNAYDFATPVTADIILYAKWIKLWSVSFNMLGHGTQIEAQQVEDGKTATKPADPTAETYDFLGWFKEEACTNAYDFATPITADITLYAKWELGVSAMNPVPIINADTKDIYLVNKQKFTLPEGSWESSNKKIVAISKKGVLTVKKMPKDNAAIVITETTSKKSINVHISQPKFNENKLKLNAGVKNSSLGFVKDSHLAVQYASSDPDVATVSENGTISCLAKGKTTVTAYVNGKAYNCKVTVNEDKNNPVTVKVLHMNQNGKKTLSIYGVSNKKISWTSSNENMASVNKKGKVKAGTTPGTVSINGISKDNRKFTVYVRVEDIGLKTGKIQAAGKKYKVELKPGEKTKIEFNNVIQPVTFKSSKGETAYVDRDGNIVANKEGKAKLTAKINGKTVTINVTVKK